MPKFETLAKLSPATRCTPISPTKVLKYRCPNLIPLRYFTRPQNILSRTSRLPLFHQPPNTVIMKAHLNTISRQNLPPKVKQQLNLLIMENDAELIFFSREHLCSLPTLTVIIGKNTDSRQLQELQQHDWVRNSIEKPGLIIAVNAHSSHAPEPDLHFSYIVLNCHPRHLIYARTEKSWNSRFQNDYSLKQSRNEKQFRAWQSGIENQCAAYYSQFIAPNSDTRSEDVLQAGLKAVYEELLSGFRKIFLPKNLHSFYKGAAVLDFMQQHVPELKQPLAQIEGHAIKRILDRSTTVMNETQRQEHLDYVQILRGIFSTNLAHLFYGKFRQTLSWNQYAEVYLQKPVAAEKPERDLPAAIAEIIKQQYKTQYIYWVPQKASEGQPRRYLLIMLGSSLKITQLHFVQQLMATHFPELQICILLHKTDWIKKHYGLFYGFIDRYLSSEYLIDRSQKELSFPAKVEQERDGLVRRYWAERKEIIDVQWTSVGFPESEFTEGQVLYLRSIFQQLFLGTLYHYAHYLPNTLNLNYLWELITWFAPELPQKIRMNRPMQEVLAFIGTPVHNFPNIDEPEVDISTISFQEAVSCCSRLYEHLNNELS
ncbi:hypothetical protein FIC_00234 [Flavobacteriaceae bacterium 3519-10]|nr:hypothetical protein FIC_00234 [Flavobacteriaceae bacterium 3519-10]